MPKNFTIGLCATARSGKDSVCRAFIKHLADKKILARRYAFADELKKSLNAFLLLEFGINAFTEDSKEKEFIRPYLLTHGKQWREKDSDHWLKIVAEKIKEAEQPHVAIISDVRYAGNEAPWVKESGSLIHITRFDLTNKPFPPVGDDEALNDPCLRNTANYQFTWPTFGENSPMLEAEGRKLCDLLFSRYYSSWQKEHPLV